MKKQTNYSKLIVFWISIFVVGGIAGVIFSQIMLPWLASFSPFNKVGWIVRSKEGTTIINKTDKITIVQDLAYQQAISQLANSVVGVRAERRYKIVNKKQALLAKPEILAEGTGFILTGDGLIATANVLVPESATNFFVTRGSKELEVQIIKRDAINGLALLKIAESNLPVVSLGDAANLKLGEMVFLLGAKNVNGSLQNFANIGFIKALGENLSLTFSENQLANGSPMTNIKGEVIGLNLVDVNGKIKIVGEGKIREMLR